MIVFRSPLSLPLVPEIPRPFLFICDWSQWRAFTMQLQLSVMDGLLWWARRDGLVGMLNIVRSGTADPAPSWSINPPRPECATPLTNGKFEPVDFRSTISGIPP
jgi:hypothetical protein